jgi:hypothetical protein
MSQVRPPGELFDFSFATLTRLQEARVQLVLFHQLVPLGALLVWYLCARTATFERNRQRIRRTKVTRTLVNLLALAIFVPQAIARTVQLLHDGGTVPPQMNWSLLSVAVTTGAAIIAPSFMLQFEFSIAILVALLVAAGTFVEIIVTTHALALLLHAISLVSLGFVIAMLGRHWYVTDFNKALADLNIRDSALGAFVGRQEKVTKARENNRRAPHQKKTPVPASYRPSSGFTL